MQTKANVLAYIEKWGCGSVKIYQHTVVETKFASAHVSWTLSLHVDSSFARIKTLFYTNISEWGPFYFTESGTDPSD